MTSIRNDVDSVYRGARTPILGYVDVEAPYGKQTLEIPILVVEGHDQNCN